MLKNSSYGDNIHFSGENEYIARTVNKILKHGEAVYVFMDVPPNRDDIISAYDQLCMYYDGNDRVKIFPIICIEEIVVNMLRNYDYLHTNNEIEDLIINMVDNINHDGINEKHKTDDYITSSLEHLYKYILTHVTDKCLWNSNQDNVAGLFYRQSCTCDRKYCRINCTDGIDLKAERLYTSLPIFCPASNKSIAMWDNFKIKYTITTIEEVYSDINKKYSLMCERLKIGHISIHINENGASEIIMYK
jgi:hypothetical protein